MKTIVVAIIIVIGLTACDFFDIPEPDAHLRKQAIFTAENSENQRLDLYVRMPIDGYWTPAQFDIDGVFTTTVKYIQASEEDNIRPLADYKHQHIGFISDSKQYIYNNYFCDSINFDTEWYSNLISVDDGGNCFFQSVYDVAEQEIISLSINGEG